MEYVICHHGIKGQKWGIRRYQNPNGTLTPEGKDRYLAIGRKKKHISKTRDGKYKLSNFGANYVNSSYGVLKKYKAGDNISLEQYAKAVDTNRKIGAISTAGVLVALSGIGAATLYKTNQNKREQDKWRTIEAEAAYEAAQNTARYFYEMDQQGRFPGHKSGYGSYEEIE